MQFQIVVESRWSLQQSATYIVLLCKSTLKFYNLPNKNKPAELKSFG